jgi:hypothetical protein
VLSREAHYRCRMVRLLYDYLGGSGLILAAYFAWSARFYGSLRARQFSLVAAVGSIALAIDEVFSLHERLGSTLYDRGWREPAGINHFDDVLVFALGIAGIATAGFFAREILREPRFAALFGAAVALFLAAIAWDSIADPTRTRSWWTEETLELAGVLVMVVAFRERAAWLADDAVPLIVSGTATAD